MTGRPNLHLIELTDKQVEALGHLACGLDIPATARLMQISPHTARSHIRESLVRLGAASGTHAVAIAIGRGLLPTDIATRR